MFMQSDYHGVLAGCEIFGRRVRSFLITVLLPYSDLGTRFGKCQEQSLAQALVRIAAVEN